MNDDEFIDGLFKMLVVPEYHDKWWDEFREQIERFECDEKKNATAQLFLSILYLRRPEAFLKNNPELDRQFNRSKSSNNNSVRVGNVKAVNESGCTKCPKG